MKHQLPQPERNRSTAAVPNAEYNWSTPGFAVMGAYASNISTICNRRGMMHQTGERGKTVESPENPLFETMKKKVTCPNKAVFKHHWFCFWKNPQTYLKYLEKSTNISQISNIPNNWVPYTNQIPFLYPYNVTVTRHTSLHGSSEVLRFFNCESFNHRWRS